MVTKELTDNKACVFCASDYHLEMILLPYIKERLQKEKFIIITQNDLEDTMKTLLNKTNIEEAIKDEILNIDWSKKTQIQDLIKNTQEGTAIINGDYGFIKEMNKKLENRNVKIIDCFHIGDRNVDIEILSKEYDYILNTRKI